MKKTLPIPMCLFLFLFLNTAQCQLFKVDLSEKVASSTLIAEGKVVAQKSFWNQAHTIIFTANTVQLYKTFKGAAGDGQTIEILTQGGSVGNRCLVVSELLTLQKGQIGVFFCSQNTVNLKSPTSGRLLYDVYGSSQGFLRYDFNTNKAFAPFATYNDIEGSFYGQIEQLTGKSATIIDTSFSVAAIVKANTTGNHITNGTNSGASITSFFPTVVHGGTLNDPTNNILTITGSGFGSVPSDYSAINFKDGDDDNTTPDYSVPYNSPYVISWSDNQIVVNVPSKAATGLISVVLSNGSVTPSTQNLTVAYSVLNAEFDFSSVGVDTVTISEPRLMNTDNKGGYTYEFGRSTAGSGKSFAADAAANTAFNNAVATWKLVVGSTLTQGASTTTQTVADDSVNVIEYDNTNTGVPVMGAGVLEATYSWFKICYSRSPFFTAVAQKKGFDILVRNPGVSAGATISFQDGPCFPATSSYDLESIILHEIGHVLNLAHINDDYQQYPYGTLDINPGKLMHYAIVNYGDRRSLDNSAYTAGLYTVTAQDDVFGPCLYNAPMTQASYTVLSNDECPSSFPTTPTLPGTLVNFNLAAATSNKYTDPSFTQIDCQGNGVFVTNNAYYALKTTARDNGTLSLTISGYTTTPAGEASCAGQGARMALYQVSACPGGQRFPQPIACDTFVGNGALPNVTGLLPNQTYLLYFDGMRNTKANFNLTINGSTLPIVLSEFSGEYIKGVDELFIQIEQAINVKDIVIEKSADGQTFSQLGILQVAPTQLPGMHTYTDAQPYAGNNYYRLRIVDNDGNVQYSSVILLKNSATQLIYVYPNPVNDNLLVNISGFKPGRYNFDVYDISGKALLNSVQPVNYGAQTVTLPLQRLAQGVYLVKITDPGGAVVSLQKIMKQ